MENPSHAPLGAIDVASGNCHPATTGIAIGGGLVLLAGGGRFLEAALTPEQAVALGVLLQRDGLARGADLGQVLKLLGLEAPAAAAIEAQRALAQITVAGNA
jgi:hypothetical protein